MQLEKLIMGFVFALILLAVYTDIRWRIISNKLTLPAIALGLILNFACNGWQGLLGSLIGLAAGLGLMLIPFRFGQMGAGDVKLMGALGALLGGTPVLNIFFYSAIAGGILAIIAIMLKGEFRSTMIKLWLLLKLGFLYKAPSAGAQPAKSISIPYGAAIGAGAICFLIFGKIV